MIASFTVTLIECLEIALITLLLTQISASGRLYVYGIIGLILGYFTSVAFYEMVEVYECI